MSTNETDAAAIIELKYEPPMQPQLTVPVHDVNLVRLRKSLNAAALSAEQFIYAISMALVDARFAYAVDVIIDAKEPGALEAYVVAAHRDAIGDAAATTSPRTMREAVRRMNAFAIKAVGKFIQPEAITQQVHEWLAQAMKKYVLMVVGIKDDYGRLELIDPSGSKEPPLLTRIVADRCRAAVDKVWPVLVDKAIAELASEWDKILAEVLKNNKRNFSYKLTREMEKRLTAEVDHQMETLLTRALADDGGEPQDL